MAATKNSGLSHGTNGSPQTSIEEEEYSAKVSEIENGIAKGGKEPVYAPSRKHGKGGWGSRNPITTNKEGQTQLINGYKNGRQVYNILEDGTIVKFQPDNTPDNGFHSYKVIMQRDIPNSVLRLMLKDGKITKAQYNKLRKGKVK